MLPIALIILGIWLLIMLAKFIFTLRGLCTLATLGFIITGDLYYVSRLNHSNTVSPWVPVAFLGLVLGLFAWRVAPMFKKGYIDPAFRG